jgi:hypothetical protein
MPIALSLVMSNLTVSVTLANGTTHVSTFVCELATFHATFDAFDADNIDHDDGNGLPCRADKIGAKVARFWETRRY